MRVRKGVRNRFSLDYTAHADEAYTYDANGNRVGSGVEIGAHNRLLSDGTYRYEYDGEGNRLRRYIDDDQSGTFNAGDTDVTEYTWDYRNRLVTVETYATHGGSVTQQVDYAYDASNQLVKRIVDPDRATGSAALEQTVFIHGGGQVGALVCETKQGVEAEDDAQLLSAKSQEAHKKRKTISVKRLHMPRISIHLSGSW